MFLVGLELNAKELYEYGHATILMSHVSIVVPFVLASVLSIYLYPRLSDDSVSFMGFALFMGAAMAITAFPVLARILADRQLLRTRMGTIAIACAAVDDVSGWCILAYIVVLIRTSQSAESVWTTLTGLAVFLIVMIWGMRRLLTRIERRYEVTDTIAKTFGRHTFKFGADFNLIQLRSAKEQIFELDFGGRLVDTPGMRELPLGTRPRVPTLPIPLGEPFTSRG